MKEKESLFPPEVQVRINRILLALSLLLLFAALVRIGLSFLPFPHLRTLLYYGLLFTASVLYAHAFCKRGCRRRFAHRPRHSHTAAAGFPAILFTVMTVSFGGNLLVGLVNPTPPATPDHPLATILFSCIFPAFVEEILCRGAVQRSLRPLGRTAAVFGSSFVFAFLHTDPVSILYSFLAGLLLGAITVYCRSVVPAFLLHLYLNLASGVFLYLPESVKAPIYFAVLGLSLLLSLIFLRQVTRPWRHIRRANTPMHSRKKILYMLLSPLGCVMLLLLALAAYTALLL